VTATLFVLLVAGGALLVLSSPDEFWELAPGPVPLWWRLAVVAWVCVFVACLVAAAA
jgi:hypothetical protein